jgi:hypothetical protein
LHRRDHSAPAVERSIERIRCYALTRRGSKRDLAVTTRDRARAAYDRLRPRDPVVRHGWLFADQWVQESAGEIEEIECDYQKRDARIDRLRRDAMAEIWAHRAFEGIQALLAGSRAAGTVGRYAASCVAGVKGRIEFIACCLAVDGGLRSKAEWCLQGFLWAIPDDARDELLHAAADALPDQERLRLFLCAPFQAATWRLLDSSDEIIRATYWKDVFPSRGRHTSAELMEIVDRLLEAQRPRAAFHAVHMDFKDIETSRLKRLLHEVTTSDAEPAGQFKLDRYYISQALNA